MNEQPVIRKGTKVQVLGVTETDLYSMSTGVEVRFGNQIMVFEPSSVIPASQGTQDLATEYVKLYGQKAELEKRVAFAEDRAQELESKLNQVADAMSVLNSVGE
jgi:hypothetical protein